MPSADLPMLAVREVADQDRELVIDGDAACRVAGPVPEIPVAARPHRPQAPTLDADDCEVDVVLDRQPAEESRLLVRAGKTHLRAGARRLVGHVHTEDRDRPGGGREVAGYDVEERRLAGAVGTENAPPLALADLEIDVLDCVKTAKTPADPPEQEGRRGAWKRE